MLNNGGPAFPGRNSFWSGMTLRDWFAGQWMAGAMSVAQYNPEPKTLASDAYVAADAMLAERAKEQGQ